MTAKYKKKEANDVNGTPEPPVSRSVASGNGAKLRTCEDPKVETKRKPRPYSNTNIACWNVRTMNSYEKLENVTKEMIKYKINILGLCETRWKDEGDFLYDNYRVIYAGGKHSQRGVALILDRKWSERIIKIELIDDRLMAIELQAEPANIVIIQVYMPTSNSGEIDIENMYEKIEDIIDKNRASDNVIIMGDFNAVVGQGQDGKEVEKYGLGTRNERGNLLVEFCKRRKFVVTNTWFQHHPRRRYTWKQPGDLARYQIDYILVRQRYRNGVKNSHSYPGADINSDHNLVKMRMNIKMKKIMKPKKCKKWNTQILS